MKKLLIACCAALALASCAPTTGSGLALPGVDPVVSLQGTSVDEKALIAAELAYITAAQSYVTARDRQLLPAETLATARAALIRSFDALKLARTAYRAGDANSFAAQAALVISAAAEANRLLPQP